MRPLIDALAEAYAWRPCSTTQAQGTGQPAMILRHPSGQVIHVLAAPSTWLVTQKTAASPKGILRARLHKDLSRAPRRRTLLDRIFQTRYAPVLREFQDDLHRGYGPQAQAQLTQVIQDISVFGVVSGLRGVVHIRSESPVMRLDHLFSGCGMDMPPELYAAWLACGHILKTDPKTPHLSSISSMSLDLPTTAHGVMDFLERIRSSGPVAG